MAPHTAWVGPGLRAAWAAGRRLMSRAGFAKVPPRQGCLQQEGRAYSRGAVVPAGGGQRPQSSGARL